MLYPTKETGTYCRAAKPCWGCSASIRARRLASALHLSWGAPAIRLPMRAVPRFLGRPRHFGTAPTNLRYSPTGLYLAHGPDLRLFWLTGGHYRALEGGAIIAVRSTPKALRQFVIDHFERIERANASRHSYKTWIVALVPWWPSLPEFQPLHDSTGSRPHSRPASTPAMPSPGQD
jgi:hypothetical protein